MPELKARIDALPATVDSNVRRTLTDGVAHLGQLVSQQCGQVTVPDVTGKELDKAENELRARGIRFKEAGGGLFGVVVRSNWRACELVPAPGSRINKESEITLVVGRSC